LYRYDRMEDRYYFRFSYHPEWVSPIKTHSYISTTSLGRNVVPMGAAYYKWLMSLGADAMIVRNKKAIFGSLFHREALSLLTEEGHPIHGKGYDFDYLDEEVPNHFYFTENNDRRPCTQLHMMVPPEWRYDVENWRFSFKRGLMAWFQFISERVEKVHAIEIPLTSEKYQVAGTLDMVADVNYYRKSRPSVVDIKSFLYLANADKSASKSYFDAHEFQLEILKMIWNENFGEQLEITHLFNWSPKDWRGDTPTYTLKNQTETKYGRIGKVGQAGDEFTAAEQLCMAAQTMGVVKPPVKVARIGGAFDSIDNFDAANHIRKFTLTDDGTLEEETKE